MQKLIARNLITHVSWFNYESSAARRALESSAHRLMLYRSGVKNLRKYRNLKELNGCPMRACVFAPPIMCSKLFLVTAFNRGLPLINLFADLSCWRVVVLRVGIELM